MHNCHSITAWYVLVMLSFYDTCSACHRSMHYAAMRYCIVWSMGTTGITLHQHFVIARPSSAIGIKHNKCLFWDDIVHVIVCMLQSYDVIYLWLMLSTLSIYAHCYDAIPSIMHNCLVPPHDACSSCYHCMIHVLLVIGLCIMLRCDAVLYVDHHGDHRYVIHLDGFKLLVAGQRCHNVDSLIRDTASHSDHWVVRRATVTLNDPTTTGW